MNKYYKMIVNDKEWYWGEEEVYLIEIIKERGEHNVYGGKIRWNIKYFKNRR